MASYALTNIRDRITLRQMHEEKVEQCRIGARDLFTKHTVQGFEAAPEDVQGMDKFVSALVALRDDMDARYRKLQVCTLMSRVQLFCASTWSLQLFLLVWLVIRNLTPGIEISTVYFFPENSILD